jgi:hypothetical protein
VTGYYQAGDGSNYDFVRAPDGTITNFGVQGASFFVPISIDAKGRITGYYDDIVIHGFKRSIAGTLRNLDPPGSTVTIPESINNAGSIAGSYTDDGGAHGFVRIHSGDW